MVPDNEAGEGNTREPIPAADEARAPAERKTTARKSRKGGKVDAAPAAPGGEPEDSAVAAVTTDHVSPEAEPVDISRVDDEFRADAESGEIESDEIESEVVEPDEVDEAEVAAEREESDEVDVAAVGLAASEEDAAEDAETADPTTAEVATAEVVTVESESDEPAAAVVEADFVEDDEGPETRPDELRLIEALLFAASEPIEEKALGKRLPAGTDVHAGLKRLQLEYAPRGVNLVRIGTKWTFRTANDLAWLLTHEASEPKKLSRAAVETLAIIAYHQPVTRAEIEEIRGVAVAKGTIDVLLETGWIRPRGRRKAPGRPLTYGTTDQFLSHFGLEALGDLPGLDELKGAGLFDGQLPSGFGVPNPSDDPALRDDEDPIDAVELDLGLAPRVEDAPAGESAEPGEAGEPASEAPAREEGD
ncbi:SMC-Scp complex subunit ScpB [Rhodoplanes roseus]|uniref:SMC-Scp complex subunit ScpB n=1 Tax=Rhodoplanes roseus TaxID=29409 RepID=UPI001AECD1C4